MGYSVKVSHVRGFSSPKDVLNGCGPLAAAYPEATPEQKDNIRRRLVRELGGRGAEQAIKAAMGQVELV